MPGTHQHGAAEGVQLAHTIYGTPVEGSRGIPSGGNIQPAGLHSTLPYKPPKRRAKDNPNKILCPIDGCKAFPTKATGYCVGHSAKMKIGQWKRGGADGDAQ